MVLMAHSCPLRIWRVSLGMSSRVRRLAERFPWPKYSTSSSSSARSSSATAKPMVLLPMVSPPPCFQIIASGLHLECNLLHSPSPVDRLQDLLGGEGEGGTSGAVGTW